MLNRLNQLVIDSPGHWAEEVEHCDWIKPLFEQEMPKDLTPLELSDRLAVLHSAHFDEEYRKAQGQFFTPPAIARFMVELVTPLRSGDRVVEPGAGCGILIAALAEQICRNSDCHQWHVTAYEIDASLRPALYVVLSHIKQWLGQRDIEFDFDIVLDDFILANASHLTPTPLLLDLGADAPRPNLIIANPPYFKVRKSDPRVALLAETVYGQPNVYTLFMAAAAKLLQPEGELVFITPRSFCAGPYFQRFRKWFFKTIALKRVHLFESRTEAFDRNEVLQENIIIAGTKTTTLFSNVDISVSQGVSDLESTEVRQVAIGDVIDIHSDDAVLSIPVQPSDFAVRALFRHWTDRLHTLGLEISTGPIVPFRTDALVTEGVGNDTTPVIWVQHVERMAVNWPRFHFAKPQWLRVRPETYSLLLPNANYVLVRRFSAKEDNSRITAAPYLGGSLPSEYLGIENHVNYIHRPGGKISESEALSLAAYLNSRWVDQYFRVSSSNTQISATELRSLPMPPREKILHIGEQLQQAGVISQIALINEVVGEVLSLPSQLR